MQHNRQPSSTFYTFERIATTAEKCCIVCFASACAIFASVSSSSPVCVIWLLLQRFRLLWRILYLRLSTHRFLLVVRYSYFLPFALELFNLKVTGFHYTFLCLFERKRLQSILSPAKWKTEQLRTLLSDQMNGTFKRRQ